MSLLRRLLLLVSLAVLPAVGILAHGEAEIRRMREAEFRERAARVAEAAARELERVFEDARALLIGVAEDGTPDAAGCARLLRRLDARFVPFPGVSVLDAAGRVVCTAHAPLPADARLADRPWFRRTIQTGAFVVGDHTLTRYSRRDALPLAVPVRDDAERIAGVAVLAIDLAWLERRFASFRLPPGASLTVLDRRGVLVLARLAAPGPAPVGRPGPADLVRLLAEPGAGVVEHDGRIVGFVPPAAAPGGGMLVAVGFERATAFAATDAAGRRDLLLIALVLAAALAAAAVGGRLFLGRPIEELSRAAGRWRAGDYAARADVRGGASEIGRLGRDLNAVAAALAAREDERDRSLAELRRSQEEFRRLVAANLIGVVFATPERITQANDAFLRMVGMTREAFTRDGFDWRARTPPGHEAADARALRQLAETGECAPFEKEYLTEAGQPVPVLLGAAVIEPGTARFIGFIADLSAQKRAEAELRRLNASLELRVAERNAALEAEMRERRQAEERLVQAQKVEAIGQIAGNVAHDFNNILTAIINNVELARIVPGPEGEEALEAALTAARDAAALVRQMLGFARRSAIAAEPVDLGDLLTALLPLLRRSCPDNVRVELRAGEGPLRVEVDPSQAQVAVLNLVLNARDALPAGGRITLTAERRSAPPDHSGGLRPGAHVRLTVADTGAGMTPDVLERAFEPFFTTKDAGRGTGLGLGSVQGFARRAGGDVRLDSRPGAGCRVVLDLPECRPAPPGPGDAPEAPAADEPRDFAPGAPPQVLVVEDNPLVGAATVAGLRRLGCRTVEASDGRAALRLLRRHPEIDLLLTDVDLPGINGYELAAEARRRRPDLKILFVTGHDPGTRPAWVESDPSADGLAKPYDLDALTRAVRRLRGAGAAG